MKMNKILLVVALLVSARAFAWRPTMPAVKVPDFAKNAAFYVTAKTCACTAFCWNKVPAMPKAKEVLTSGLTHLKDNRLSNLVANHPKTALGSAAAVAAFVGAAIFGKKFAKKATPVPVVCPTIVVPTPAVPATNQR